MFFEPMLTLPLHRNFVFSLQELSRATIVSHTTYDGIDQLCVPKMLKSYLKEYHYKQRVHVKRLDDYQDSQCQRSCCRRSSFDSFDEENNNFNSTEHIFARLTLVEEQEIEHEILENVVDGVKPILKRVKSMFCKSGGRKYP